MPPMPPIPVLHIDVSNWHVELHLGMPVVPMPSDMHVVPAGIAARVSHFSPVSMRPLPQFGVLAPPLSTQSQLAPSAVAHLPSLVQVVTAIWVVGLQTVGSAPSHGSSGVPGALTVFGMQLESAAEVPLPLAHPAIANSDRTTTNPRNEYIVCINRTRPTLPQ